MVKIERSFPAPASLESEAKKVSGSYTILHWYREQRKCVG